MKVNKLLAELEQLAPDERILELEKLADEIRAKLKAQAKEKESKEEKATDDDLDNVLALIEETNDEISVLDSMLSTKKRAGEKNLEDIATQEAVVNQKKKDEEAIAELKRDENFYGKVKYAGDVEGQNKLDFDPAKKQFYEKTAAEQLIEEHKQKDKYLGNKAEYKS